FRVAEPMAEAADAGLKDDALREMAQAAGGRYFPFAGAAALPDELAKSMRDARFSGMKPVDMEIWDNPLLLALILGLLTAEWMIRRRSGLA
ncbi:MAG: hypothetical protein PHQ12_15075, partial [Chthoniobacteraceae bacterium]|nr:hypothetical protein [Chthoniobacteraceae bacterium]